MKFQLDKNGKETLERLLDIHAYSQEASDLLSTFLTDRFDAIDISLLQRLRKELSCSLEDAYYPAFLSVLDIDPEDEELKSIEKNTAIQKMVRRDEREFLSNPYLKNIRFQDRKEGKWHLTKNYYLPYEAFLYDQTKARKEDLYLPVDFLGYFDKRVDYPLVEEKDHVWMSVTPYEIRTMEEGICLAHGRVLALGLGLGYFPYMVLRKKDVQEVVVVEKDPNVIALFKKNILPQFGAKKLTIIKDDAFAFLGKEEAKSFDTYFFDTHSTPEDALLPYREYLRFQKGNPHKDMAFWIESSTLVYLRRLLVALIQEESNGLFVETPSHDLTDRILNDFHRQLQDKVLTTSDDLLNLLDEDSLRQLHRDSQF